MELVPVELFAPCAPSLRSADGAGDAEGAALGAGTARIVPRGRWHRLELDGPADLMPVTMRRGSRPEPRE